MTITSNAFLPRDGDDAGVWLFVPQGAGATTPDCILVNDGSGPKGTTPVRAQLVTSGLEVPWGIAFLRGACGWCVGLQGGQ